MSPITLHPVANMAMTLSLVVAVAVLVFCGLALAAQQVRGGLASDIDAARTRVPLLQAAREDVPQFERLVSEARAIRASASFAGAGLSPRQAAMAAIVGYPEPTVQEMRSAFEAQVSRGVRIAGPLGHASIADISKVGCMPASPRQGWICETVIQFGYDSGNPIYGLLQGFANAVGGAGTGYRSVNQFVYVGGQWHSYAVR